MIDARVFQSRGREHKVRVVSAAIFNRPELELASMDKAMLAVLAVLAAMQFSLPAMAAERGRVVGCRERCDKSACQASPAYCERRRKACLAECK
jgi:hypothetical protein